MAKKSSLQKALSAAKTVYNKSHVRKANTYIQKGNTLAQKANKGIQATMGVANVTKSTLDKALDTENNNPGVFV